MSDLFTFDQIGKNMLIYNYEILKGKVDVYTNPFGMLDKEAKNVFNTIQKNGPLTKNQLLTMTNSKLTTLNRIMQPLEESKIIVETDVGHSTGGRKPALYGVNPGRYYIAGVDISRTYSQVIITNLKMDILFNRQFKMDVNCTPETVVKIVSKIFNDALVQLSISNRDIIGVGVGTIGPLNREKGVVINPKDFSAPGWANVPIKSMLEDGFGVKVDIDNGANTAVLAEYLFGCGKDFDNIAYFNCGIGIRTGVIASGNIVRAVNDAEDAFGHMTIDVGGELCSCGNYGCIDCYSTIKAIFQKYISSIRKGRLSGIPRPLEEINYIDICNAADSVDEVAREVITNAATVFGIGLANYINLLNPNLVILSGPLVKHSNLFYEVSTNTALKRCHLKERNKVIFSNGGYFKENVIAVGASAMVVENYLNKENWGVNYE